MLFNGHNLKKGVLDYVELTITSVELSLILILESSSDSAIQNEGQMTDAEKKLF